MDNWHVTPRLSLQLGLRYDALPHAWERSNAVSNFDPALYTSTQAPIFKADGSLDPSGPGFRQVDGTPFYLNGIGLAGQNSFPRGLVENDYNTLQPRIGFSEDIFGNGKTVLRGGFGTFYERMQGNDIYNAATTPPFAYHPSQGKAYFSDPFKSWNTGISAGAPFFPSSITNLPQTYKAPAVAQFSLGVQHELSPSLIWVVQYVGNLAWHQNINRHINTFSINTDLNTRCNSGDGNNKYPGDVCPNGHAPSNSALTIPDAIRQFPGWGDIKQQENTTNGNYNGFQTGLRVQNRWGLSGELDYTWSHEIDLTTYDLNDVSNPFNLKYDKGSGALDRRNILSANYVYKLPIFAKSAGMIIKKVRYLKKKGEWFDTSAFAPPVPVWLGGANQGFGSARKDAIVGPSRVNFTTSLYKSFAMTERAHIELRFESFNTFNHFEPNGLNISGPDPKIYGDGVGNSQFGQITSAWDPRVMELGGKFIF